jgi:hypothetical protein
MSNKIKDWHVEAFICVLIIVFLFLGAIFCLNEMDKQGEYIMKIIEEQRVKK